MKIVWAVSVVISFYGWKYLVEPLAMYDFYNQTLGFILVLFNALIFGINCFILFLYIKINSSH